MKYVYLMTKNKGKLAAAQSVFDKYGVEVRSLDFDVPEIQADTSAEIAKNMVLQAFEKFREPVIREDHSLFIDEINFPGPFMAFAEKNISAEKLTQMIKDFKSTSGRFELAAAYCDKDGNIHAFSYSVPIVFETIPRGVPSDGWNQLIRFPDEKRVFTEYSSEERNHVWSKNYEEIAKLI
jgi:XTP/dITP diphosphohydrolase